jgi:hypothetical protein
MEVQCGLSQVGDFHRCLHGRGDYSDVILEQMSQKEVLEWDSEEDRSEDGSD